MDSGAAPPTHHSFHQHAYLSFLEHHHAGAPLLISWLFSGTQQSYNVSSNLFHISNLHTRWRLRGVCAYSTPTLTARLLDLACQNFDIICLKMSLNYHYFLFRFAFFPSNSTQFITIPRLSKSMPWACYILSCQKEVLYPGNSNLRHQGAGGDLIRNDLILILNHPIQS